MACLLRLSLPSIPQHVIQRGNNHQACFYVEEDYRFYLECLGTAVRKYRVDVAASAAGKRFEILLRDHPRIADKLTVIQPAALWQSARAHCQ